MGFCLVEVFFGWLVFTFLLYRVFFVCFPVFGGGGGGGGGCLVFGLERTVSVSASASVCLSVCVDVCLYVRDTRPRLTGTIN